MFGGGLFNCVLGLGMFGVCGFVFVDWFGFTWWGLIVIWWVLVVGWNGFCV